MNKKSRLNSVVRAVAMCLMVGGLLVSSSGEKAKGTQALGCGLEFHNCLDNCEPGTAGAACRQQCNDTYDYCVSDSPEPWPVVDNSRSGCLEGCQQECGSIETFPERFACYDPCWQWCDETYPKP